MGAAGAGRVEPAIEGADDSSDGASRSHGRGQWAYLYYVTHRIVPLGQTIANLNMDMIGRNENDANWPVPPDGNVNMVNVLGTRYNHPKLTKIIRLVFLSAAYVANSREKIAFVPADVGP